MGRRVRVRALRALPTVCRTGYQLFMFLDFVLEMRGSGLTFRKGVAAWYEQRDDQCPRCGAIGCLHGPVDLVGQPARRLGVLRCAVCTNVVEERSLRGVDWLAFQMIKYRQRDGWSHKRAIDLSHPKPPSAEHEGLYRWALGYDDAVVPERVSAFKWAQLAQTPADTVKQINANPWLPREALRTEHANDPDVWRAMLDARMPMHALLRNLGRMSGYGVLKPLDRYTSLVCKQLTDQRALVGARVHPMALLNAMVVYHSGQGFRSRWEPVRAVLDALDEAFYLSFKAVEPANKRTLLALDVSGSMRAEIGGFAGLDCRTGAAAMALVTAATEPMYDIVAFASNRVVAGVDGRTPDPDFYDPHSPGDWAIKPVDISPRMRLADAVDVMAKVPAGGTDCSRPMAYALSKGLSVDTFVIYTDNETWAGGVHPAQALQHYRKATGVKDAKLVVVGMSATPFTIADPSDVGMLDVVGFDVDAPNLISAFSRGVFDGPSRRDAV